MLIEIAVGIIFSTYMDSYSTWREHMAGLTLLGLEDHSIAPSDSTGRA